jgi:tetratricopeptide (TPR) repeat protein
MPIPATRLIWLAVALAQLAATAPAFGQASAPLGQPAPAIQPQADLETLRRQALDEEQAGKTADAIRDYQQALGLDPEWKEGRWNLGMLQYGADDFAAAKDTFQKVVEFAPHLGSAWALLGLSEFETADYADALSHLEKAQSLGIDDAEIRRVSTYHLGILLIRACEFERATALLRASFGSGNVSPQAKTALGLALLRVPLLPSQLDPSREALVLAAGDAATAGAGEPARLADLLRANPALPYLHLAYGMALASAGRENEAREAILEETRISPASPLPWIELSRLEFRKGDVSESLQAAQHAVAVAPEDREAHEALARAWDAAGKPEQAAGARQSAQTAAMPAVPEQRIVQLYANPNAARKADTTPEANRQLWNRALAEYAAGQYAGAIPDLKAWLAGTPENGTGWAMLGLCDFALKDFDNALIHLDRGAKLGLSASPASLYQARYTFGILLVHASQFDRAADVLLSATKATGPLAAKVEYALGLALLHKAEFPEAVSPAQTELITEAGRIELLLLDSQYDQAFPQLKLLLKRYPNTPFLHYAYGTALIALSQFDMAAAEMQAETVLSPASELPYARLASIALRQHDFAAAVRWAQRALQLAPNSADAHYLLGRASLEAGDLPSATRELETAAALSPASPEIHFNLAKAYARAKLPEKAQQERDLFSRLSATEQGHPARQNSPGPPEPSQSSRDAIAWPVSLPPE